MSDVAQAPGVVAAVPGHLAGAAAGRLGAAAQHGLDGRQPVPAGALQLLPRRDVAVQQARPGQRLRARWTASTAATRSSAPATTASPPIRPTSRSRWSPSTRSCTRAGPTASGPSPIDDFFLLPGDTPEREHPLEHGELIVAIEVPRGAGRAPVGLPEVPRPRVVRVRAGLGRGRGARRGRRDRRGPAGARRRRHQAVARAAGRAEPARPARRRRPASPRRPRAGAGRRPTPRPHNAFKVELAQRAIVRALTTPDERRSTR